ncbi:MAG: hypothetical protein AAGG51_10015 [Cyanobacteria bacterium P01_G01_bin.54]
MAYRDFKTLKSVRQKFGLTIHEQVDLFKDCPTATSTLQLSELLAETLPLALAINTEKARSEMLITPILLELRRQAQSPLSLFSGTEFNVDEAEGLVGFCDYILSRSPEQLTLNAPVMLITEAKNENIKAGLGQCLAEMVAAQQFNQAENNPIEPIYGAVTTGEIWRFLRLNETTAAIDLTDYYLARDLPKILGLLNLSLQP